jgi:branched-chain amino acid transport system substrate-binding protein
MRQLFAGILAICALIALPGCNKPAGSGDSAGVTINVGEFASLTGKEAAFGNSSHKGTLLAVDDINAAGGVLGKKLNLVTEDNRSTQGESATVVKKLISREKVVAVLGEVASGRSLEGASVCQANKIPMISPSSTKPEVTEKGDYIFRVCFIDPFQGKVLATFAKQTLKVDKVALLIDAASPYSVGLGSNFKDTFTSMGGSVVIEQKFSSGDKDFKAQLTAIKGAAPQALFAPCYYTEAGLIVRQARDLGLTVPIFGGDGWEAPELLEIGGPAIDGTYYSTHYSAEDQAPKVQEFVKKYKAKWNNESPDAMAALGYDSAMVLADAMKRAGTTDGPKLREAIAATKDFEGVTGKTTLDEHRNATKPAVIIAIKDGKFKYLETIKP